MFSTNHLCAPEKSSLPCGTFHIEGQCHWVGRKVLGAWSPVCLGFREGCGVNIAGCLPLWYQVRCCWMGAGDWLGLVRENKPPFRFKGTSLGWIFPMPFYTPCPAWNRPLVFHYSGLCVVAFSFWHLLILSSFYHLFQVKRPVEFWVCGVLFIFLPWGVGMCTLMHEIM